MRPYLAILGFILLAVGFLSLVLDLLGLQFIFMRWISSWDGLLRAILYMVMCFSGVVLMYLNLVDWRYDPDAPEDIS